MGLPGMRLNRGAILLLLVLIGVPLCGPLPARAQADADEAFTVRGIEVDVTAESAAAARDRALLEAQRKAFDQLLLSLASPGDVAALPPLSEDAISDMVLDFEVLSEQTSSVRYIGEFAFRFQPEPVRRYLEQSGASYAVRSSRPALVLPVLTTEGSSLLWEEGNAWLEAWSRTPVSGTLVPIAVPLGDLEDIATVDAQRALNGESAALQAMSDRYGAGEVIVAEARPSIDEATGAARLTVSAKRYGPGGLAGEMRDELGGQDGEAGLPALYAQAAQRVTDFVQAEWKQENLVSSTVEQHLDVAVPLTSLEEWIELRRRLAEVTVVRRADLLSLSREEARLDLVFIGDQGQLSRALARRSLVLDQVPVTPQPTQAPAPQTTGSVTVYPEAAIPPVAPAMPRWELRMSGSSMPAAAPSGQPAPVVE